MSMVDSPHVRATMIPFVLFVIATLVVWRLWGQQLTILLLTVVLALTFVRDYIAWKRFSE